MSKITIDRSVVEQALACLVRASVMYSQPNDAQQEALRAALEQPEMDDCNYSDELIKAEREIEKLRERLARVEQPEQEPVCWQWLDTANFRKKLPADAVPEHWRPLFATPTPRKPDVPEAGFWESVGTNGLTEAETEASASVAGLVGFARCPRCWEPITAPTPRKPVELKDGEIGVLWKRHTAQCNPYDDDGLGFARTVIAVYKRKNGITGESK